MPPNRWARVLQSGAYGLRRGAWYPVVNESSSRLVILDVSKKNVPVDRTTLQLSDEKPGKWSVVKWQAGRPLPYRMTDKNLPRIYAVCPECRNRSEDLPAGVQALKCPGCGNEAVVDWDNAC